MDLNGRRLPHCPRINAMLPSMAMSQPVELSDELILDACKASEITERTIARQIEYWVQLGRAIETMLNGPQSLAPQRSGAVVSVAECFANVDTAEGRQRVFEYLASKPFPHFESAPDGNGLLIRTEEDGTKTRGRFVDRQFRAE